MDKLQAHFKSWIEHPESDGVFGPGKAALLRFPRRDVASLHGERWLQFLSAGTRRYPFPADVARALERGVYAPPEAAPRDQAEAWITATRSWIRRIT